jgi:hypothetical protein
MTCALLTMGTALKSKVPDVAAGERARATRALRERKKKILALRWNLFLAVRAAIVSLRLSGSKMNIFSEMRYRGRVLTHLWVFGREGGFLSDPKSKLFASGARLNISRLSSPSITQRKRGCNLLGVLLVVLPLESWAYWRVAV